jgi:hypothetical protein
MSTGNRTILGRISKRGNRYLRTRFMQRARVILLRPANWAKHSFGCLTASIARLRGVGYSSWQTPGGLRPPDSILRRRWETRPPRYILRVEFASGNNLTREKTAIATRFYVMKQAASIHSVTLPMLLPGIAVSTSADDFAPIKQMQFMKFDATTWKLFGGVISASGR